MLLYVGIPEEVTIPENFTCRGLQGVSNDILTCEKMKQTNTIQISDAFVSKDVQPEVVEFRIESLLNPATNLVTQSFNITTKTYDYYLID